TINVAFTPSAMGARSGAITIVDSASSSPQTVPLSGTGVVNLSLSAGNVNFGNQTVGTTSVIKTVSLTNGSSIAISITGVATAGDFSQGKPAGGSLAA